jgi:1-acyl-sn-glycerol-3-phosphate acyltransferase
MDLPEQVPGAERSQFALLGVRRFLPFFLTQFLGAFNDNLFRNALVVSLTYGATAAVAGQDGVLSNVAQGLFILPFFLFSALAGQLADKYEKSRLIRQTRLAEVVLMCCAAAALYVGHIPTLLALVFLLGVLATLFGPLKYSLMPQHLRQSELVGGNALVDAGTFIAILIGTISGGLLVPTPSGTQAAGTGTANTAAAIAMIVVALGTYACSRFIPRAEATDPALKVNFNPVSATWQALKFAAQSRAIMNSLLGISWFWLVGALILAQLPAYSRDVLGGDKTVYTMLLAAFSIGTALGSLACERLSGHKVEIGLVPLGSIGMTVCLLDLYFEHPLATLGCVPLDWSAFLSQGGWDVVLDCALIGLFGGLFIVPLYALILSRSVESHRARIIACNNILNAGFMVIAALLAIVWLEVLHLSIPQLFIAAAVLNAVVAIYIYTLVPEFLMRFLSWVFVNIMYRIRVQGLENIPETGPALLVCNHVSFMDALVIGGSVRRPVRFVMDHNIFRIPVMGFIFRTAHAIPIAPAREDASALARAFDRIDAELAAGEVVCIFPEGKLTRHGEMNEFKRGVEKILERRSVPVVPMALRGLWGSFFSHRDGKKAMSQVPKRFWSRIELIATAPVHGDDASATGLQRIVAGLRGEWQ